MSRQRHGYILYVVLTLLAILGIFIASLSRFQRGTVTQLARTVTQNRLAMLAQSGANELWACLKSEVNDPTGKGTKLHFWSMLREVHSLPPHEQPPKKLVVRERFFPVGDLPHANAIAKDSLGGTVEILGHCRVTFNSRVKTCVPSYMGFIEVVVQARSIADPKHFVELKERRDLKLVNLRDFLDKYVLFVKDYGFDYNRLSQRLVIEGLPDPKHLSRVFFGSRYAPDYQAFKGLPKDEIPQFFDLNFAEDQAIMAQLLKAGVGSPGGLQEIPVAEATAREKSKDQIFWARGTPISFQSIYNKAGFTDADFYGVKSLQDAYFNTFVVSAQKAPNNDNPHSVAYMILKDWQACGGDYAKSKVFRQVVATCVKNWQYLYGYTDAQHLWKGATWSDFARALQFSGLRDYVGKMKDYHPDKMISGNMAALFGPTADRPVIVEGHAFLRFFKVALLDEFKTDMILAGKNFTLAIRPMPLDFCRPDEPITFLNKSVKIEGSESVLMSREVSAIPLNQLYGTGLLPKPQGVKGSPDMVLPTLKTSALSYRYTKPEDFLRERVTYDPVLKENVLNVDGHMFIERGNLDLSNINRFRGQGVIWIGFRGNCLLGDLKKTKNWNTLRIWVQDGNFVVQSKKPTVRIEASLIALSYFPPKPGRSPADLENRGKLIPNQHGIDLIGNLAVDYLFLADPTYGVPTGKQLRIVHDPYLYSPPIENWASVGQIRTAIAMHTDPTLRVIK